MFSRSSLRWVIRVVLVGALLAGYLATPAQARRICYSCESCIVIVFGGGGGPHGCCQEAGRGYAGCEAEGSGCWVSGDCGPPIVPGPIAA